MFHRLINAFANPLIYLLFGGALLAFVLLKIWIYLVLPLRIRRRNQLAVEPDFKDFDLGLLPPETAAVFQSTVPQLASSGFIAIANLYLEQPSQIIHHSFQSIWSNADFGDSAHVLVAMIPVRNLLRASCVVFFRRSCQAQIEMSSISGG